MCSCASALCHATNQTLHTSAVLEKPFALVGYLSSRDDVRTTPKYIVTCEDKDPAILWLQEGRMAMLRWLNILENSSDRWAVVEFPALAVADTYRVITKNMLPRNLIRGYDKKFTEHCLPYAYNTIKKMLRWDCRQCGWIEVLRKAFPQLRSQYHFLRAGANAHGVTKKWASYRFHLVVRLLVKLVLTFACFQCANNQGTIGGAVGATSPCRGNLPHLSRLWCSHVFAKLYDGGCGPGV